jgi:hypothetical protein
MVRNLDDSDSSLKAELAEWASARKHSADRLAAVHAPDLNQLAQTRPSHRERPAPQPTAQGDDAAQGDGAGRASAGRDGAPDLARWGERRGHGEGPMSFGWKADHRPAAGRRPAPALVVPDADGALDTAAAAAAGRVDGPEETRRAQVVGPAALAGACAACTLTFARSHARARARARTHMRTHGCKRTQTYARTPAHKRHNCTHASPFVSPLIVHSRALSPPMIGWCRVDDDHSLSPFPSLSPARLRKSSEGGRRSGEGGGRRSRAPVSNLHRSRLFAREGDQRKNLRGKRSGHGGRIDR